MLIALGVVVTILVTSIGVLALDASGSAMVYRGGSSASCGTDYVQSRGDIYSYACRISGVHFTGLPAGIYGSNVIVARMRTPGGGAPVSGTLTITSSLYQTTLWREYYSGYGGVDQTYELYISMSSSSANPSGWVTCQYTA